MNGTPIIATTASLLNVAVGLAAIIAVGVGVMLLVGRGAKQRLALFVETNAALALLAARTGLVVSRTDTDGVAPTNFDELRGTFRGVRVVVTIESTNSDELATCIAFPGRSMKADELETLRNLVDSVAIDQGLKLALSRPPPFAKYWTLTYDRLPDADGQRLLAALERAVSLLVAQHRAD